MDIQKFSQADKFALHNAIELIACQDGHARAKMTIQEFHFNGIRSVHGGALFTLADFTFAAAANSRGLTTIAINAHISFLKPGLTGTLFAEAAEISAKGKISSYTVRITDENNEVIALFQGMGYQKSRPTKSPLPSSST